MKKMKRILSLLVCLGLLAVIFCLPAAASGSPNLIYLKFDGDTNDSSENGLSGTKEGNITFEDKGIIGKAVRFKNGGIKINEASKEFFPGNQLTFSAWIKADTDSADRTMPILSLVDSENYPVFNFYLGYGGSSFCADISFGSDEHTYANHSFNDAVLDLAMSTNSSARDKVTEKWCHLAAVFDGKTVFLYADGELGGSYDVPEDILNDDDVPLTLSKIPLKMLIAKDVENKFYNGLMDDVRLYSTALTAGEVKALYDEPYGSFNHKIILTLGEDSQYMTVDTTKMEIDPGKGTVPYIKGGRTLVPIRAIVENMGGTIGWDGKEQRVDLKVKQTDIKLWINKYEAQVNGKTVKLDTAPEVSETGRTMLPLRFVAENLGAKVEWDGNTQSITIFYSK